MKSIIKKEYMDTWSKKVTHCKPSTYLIILLSISRSKDCVQVQAKYTWTFLSV